VEDAFSTEMLEGRIGRGDRVTALAREGAVVFEKTALEAAEASDKDEENHGK